MDQQTQERLSAVEAKVDALMAKAEQAEEKFAAFLAGPGAKLARIFGIKVP